ncbi:sterol carrier family protein [Streptomyces sp. NPDC003077]|uniref:maleylpyruvate isomerase family mycothiol-dependent enzyme n=1 Tax=Streptomyces sp. NPDC003077 TaxID=3154443 RepID=UPI0033AE32F4
MPRANSGKGRARSYDPAKTRAAVGAQLARVQEAVRKLDPAQYALPTRLGDWTVRELVTHLAVVIDHVCENIELPAPAKQEVTLDRWAFTTVALAGRVDEVVRAAAETGDPAGLLDRAAQRFADVVPGAPDDRLLAVRVGAMRLDDFLVTRCVELVVHGDDLAAATGVEIAHDRQALATATRLLADAMADKAPGGSVEVRVPPFAVVQCVEGPKHTRGTPPNVVETDPLTWLRLATGRTTWDAALDAATVRASGERADLGAYLPLMG